jgi:hypothetical protein
LLSGEQEELIKIKKNNINMCERCSDLKDDKICKNNKKEIKRMKRRRSWRFFWRK